MAPGGGAGLRCRAHASDDFTNGARPARAAAQFAGGCTMKASRLTAVALVAAAALWIGSGHPLPRDSAEGQAAIRPAEQKQQPLFKVFVTTANLTPHSPTLTLSGRTEADHKVAIAARTGGVLTQLRVTRGQHVKQGEVIAVLADEAREAQVQQAQALYDQRKAELEARRLL